VAVRDQVRKICLAQPHATEQVQWGNDLVFKVGGKMFAVTNLEPGPYEVSFKAGDDEFAELIDRPGFLPAPYLARAKWVAVETGTKLPAAELSRLLKRSYELVWEKLPKKVRSELREQ
jgi:predicted DNA-binding protein (MmcQ/YjbR family)